MAEDMYVRRWMVVWEHHDAEPVDPENSWHRRRIAYS
jgi:hypothetical protein